jgi:dTDP-4-dehydrorhamnose reductase
MRCQRVLITGCGGMLGNAIYPHFKARCEAVLACDIEIRPDERGWLTYLDARDDAAMASAFKDFRPDLVLHLAAWTNIEQCEEKPADARETNTGATAIAARLAKVHDATLVYVSTGGVFDGQKDGYYTEDDVPRPLMIYGATKLDGEREVRNSGCRSFVVRPGWMVGGGPANDHKFVSYILRQLEEGQREIHAVNDRYGTPTYTHDFAKNLFVLLRSESFGTYHMTCKGPGTRFDVAKEIVHICGRSDVIVNPVDSSWFEKRFWAPRPVNEMLRNKALERLRINLMRDWRVALRDYLERDYAGMIRETGNGERLSLRSAVEQGRLAMKARSRSTIAVRSASFLE